MARKDLPSPTASNFLHRVREEIHALLGKTGSDRALTLKDAIDSGVIVPGPGGGLIPGPGAGGTYVPDLTPPPPPGSLTATAAISHILVEVPAATYTQGHGHLRTRVYGATRVGAAPAPVFDDSVEVGQFSGTVWAMPSNPATTWHLWAKWESNDGVLSATPAGGTNGIVATTAQDVELLLDALAGQITTSELASSLSTPIGQIPGISSTASAALDQAQANLAAISTMQGEIADLSGTPDYSASETYELDEIVKYSGGLYRALGTTTGNLPTNTTYWQKIGDYASLGDAVSAHAAQLSDHETRITDTEGDLTAEASARETLATQIRGSYAGTDIAMVSDGLIHSERQARTTADSTEVSARQALSAKLTGATDPASLTLGTLASGLLYEERQARASNDSAQVARIETMEAAVNSPSTGLASKASLTQLAQAEATSAGALATAQTQLRAEMDARELGLPLTQWRNLNNQQIVTITDGVVGNQALRLTGISGGYPNQGTYIPIDRTRTYRTSFWARPSADNADGLLYFSLWQFTDVGAGPVNGGRAPYKPGGVAPNQHNAAHGAQQWGFYSFTWTAADWQVGVTRVLPEFLDNYSIRPGHWEIQDFKFADVTAMELLSAQITTVQQTQVTQGQSIASLGTAVVAAQQTADSKASTAYVDSVEARVDGVEGSLSAQSTQITTLQSRVENGGNLVTNSEFALDLSGWFFFKNSGAPDTVFLRNLHPDWIVGQGTAFIRDGAQDPTPFLYHEATPEELFPVTPGKRYQWSIYTGAHRCLVQAFIYWLDSAGVRFAFTPLAENNNEMQGGPTLAGYKRLVSFGVAPAGAVAARCVLRKTTTFVGEIDSYAFFTRALFSEANATQTEPDAYSTGPMTSSLQVEATTRAAQTGELYAQYTVKTDVGGLISGYGLASTANNAAPTSAFGVQAGQFFVAPPTVAAAVAPTANLFKGFAWRDTVAGVTKYWTGSAWSTTPQSLPFVVQTTPQVINGFTVAPGIYGEAAFFARLVATRGQIGLLAVDDARIASMSVDKLVAGSIAVGQHIQSTGYVPGSSGWRINGDGTAEFSQVVVRGTIFASQGSIGGWTIGSNYLQSTTYALGTAGTRLNSDGTGQIGGLTVGQNFVQNTNFVDGVEGFSLGSNGRILAYSNAGQNIFDTAAVGAQTLLRAGSGFDLRADGQMFTTGKVQSPNGLTFFDPKASGSNPVLSVRDSSLIERVKITADGDAYFTKSLASGTWGCDVQLVGSSIVQGEFGPETILFPTTQAIWIDTGFTRPWSAFYERTLTARIGGLTSLTTRTGGAAFNGEYLATIAVDSVPLTIYPVFKTPYVLVPGQNPYGDGNSRMYIKVNVGLLSLYNGITSFRVTSIEWTLDATG